MKKKTKNTNAKQHAGESVGKRIARLRKKFGYTQVNLAKELDTIQGLISDYEVEKLEPPMRVIKKLAILWNMTTDELIGIKPNKKENKEYSLKISRRMAKVEALPPSKQKVILQTLDALIAGSV